MHKYEDSFFSTFSSFLMILDYHNEQEKEQPMDEMQRK